MHVVAVEINPTSGIRAVAAFPGLKISKNRRRVAGLGEKPWLQPSFPANPVTFQRNRSHIRDQQAETPLRRWRPTAVVRGTPAAARGGDSGRTSFGQFAPFNPLNALTLFIFCFRLYRKSWTILPLVDQRLNLHISTELL